MTQSKSFPCPSERFSELITSTHSWLSSEGFKCQKIQAVDGGTLLQIEKAGGWRRLIGMATAFGANEFSGSDSIPNPLRSLP